MLRYLFIMLFVVASISFSQVPMLDANTITMPKSQTLNKCIDQNNNITYTQFNCDEASVEADKIWIEQVNITFSTPEKTAVTIQSNMPYVSNSKLWESLDANDLDNQKGIDLLKNSLENKSLLELFDQGIKALMMRQEILDSL